jgi:S1-C subfamily serine protease
MIERLVNVLSEAGFELTYDQIADALWLAKYLPKPQSVTAVGEPLPVSASDTTPSTLPSTTGFQVAVASPAKLVPVAAIVSTGPAPGELFVPKPGMSETGKMRAMPVRVPATEALPNKADINAALRPLKRRFPSARTKILDVTATVEQIANGGPAVAIMKPAPERWLEVALIVDESASMRVWRETINEFAVLLVRHGSFRDVRPWYVNLDGASLKLYSEAGLPSSPRRLRHPKELIDPAARRLFLVVSDCVAPGWRNGAMFRAIRDWGRRGPLTLVQVLPERLWSVTALGDSTTRMRAYSACAPDFALQAQRPQFEYSEEQIVVPPVAPAMPMPVVNLEGWSVAPWAKLVANVGDATAEGVTIPAPDRMSGSGASPEKAGTKPAPEPTAADRIRRFRSAASSGAKELAGYLAAAPLYLPVMRLVQKAMMPSVRQVDLAEVLLGGLLQQVTPAEEVGRAEDVFYDFFPGVRELLQDSVRQADQVRVLREVSRLIESQTGSTIDFAALLAGDSLAFGPQYLFPMGQKFAEVAANVMSRLGWPPTSTDDATSTTPGSGTPSPLPEPEYQQQTEPRLDAPFRVFVSFSGKDDRPVRQFIARLRALDQEGWTSTWSPLDLQPGEEFQRTIEEKISNANVFIALLSPQFLTSESTRTETTAAIKKSMLILPIFLEPVSMQGHDLFAYLLNPASPPVSTSGDEVQAIDAIVDRLRGILIETLMPKVREQARGAVVSINAAGTRSCGFVVSPWGHILALAHAVAASPIIVVLPDGQEVEAVRLTTDTRLEFSLLRVSSRLKSLSFSPSATTAFPRQDDSLAVWTQTPGTLETGIGRITAIIGDLFLAQIRGATFPGIAGAPLLDKTGQVEAILQSADVQSGNYHCIPSERARQFVMTALTPQHPPAYEMQVVGLRGLLGDKEIVRELEASLRPGSGEKSAAGYHWEQVSARVISSHVARSIGDTGFVTSLSATALSIVVSERLRVDRISVAARVIESMGPNERLLRFDSIVFENMSLDGFPVQITVALQPTAHTDSMIRAVSTTHPAATRLQSAFAVSGFGRIELMQSELSGTRYSICGLRVRLDDAAKTIIEFAVITMNGVPEEALRPNTTGRENLLMWIAELDTPRRRPVLVVDGPAGSGKTTTKAILLSVASQSGKFDVVSIDLADTAYRDTGVEELMRETARLADLDAQSLPHRAQMDRDRYFRLAIDWLVGNINLRRKPAMLIFDNLDSANISSNLRRFVDLLMEIGNRSPNLILVFLGYHSVDIPTNARQHVFIELLSSAHRPGPQGTGRFGVLVVGTGSYNLPKPVELAAQEVGVAVAAAGCTLITGGWPGVDHVAARAFTESRNPQNPSSVNDLVQIVDEPQQPDFKGGAIVRVPHNQGTLESLKRADLVILIGGAGGTWQAFRRALATNKLVLPLMSTGTDARRAAILLEILGQYVPSLLIRADFTDPSGAQSARRLLLDTLQTVDVRAATRTVDNSDLLWMVNKVLPLANEYLRKKDGFEEQAQQIFEEFKSHELPSQKRTKLVTALIEDLDPAWRIAGYLAIEARHSDKHAALLMASLDKEVKEGLERIETRPLWRWLSVIHALLVEYPSGLPFNLTLRLEELARTLQARQDVDPGGECKRLLGSILRSGKPIQNSTESKKETKAVRENRKKKSKKKK